MRFDSDCHHTGQYYFITFIIINLAIFLCLIYSVVVAVHKITCSNWHYPDIMALNKIAFVRKNVIS